MLPFRFNGTLNRFEEVAHPRKIYQGVHKYMEKMLMPVGVGLEKLHEALAHKVPVAGAERDSKEAKNDSMKFGSDLHERVAILAESKDSSAWSTREVKRRGWDKADGGCLSALIFLLQKMGIQPFKGDLAVGDTKRSNATGIDLLGVDDKNAHVVIEIKVFRCLQVADFIDKDTPKLREPFDTLPFTAGFLAQVQAALTLQMFQESFPARAENSYAAVVIVDRSKATAHWRPVSEAALLTAKCMNIMFDLDKAGAAQQSTADVFRLTRLAKEQGIDYKEAKENDDSELATFKREMRERLAKAKT